MLFLKAEYGGPATVAGQQRVEFASFKDQAIFSSLHWFRLTHSKGFSQLYRPFLRMGRLQGSDESGFAKTNNESIHTWIFLRFLLHVDSKAD